MNLDHAHQLLTREIQRIAGNSCSVDKDCMVPAGPAEVRNGRKTAIYWVHIRGQSADATARYHHARSHGEYRHYMDLVVPDDQPEPNNIVLYDAHECVPLFHPQYRGAYAPL